MSCDVATGILFQDCDSLHLWEPGILSDMAPTSQQTLLPRASVLEASTGRPRLGGSRAGFTRVALASGLAETLRTVLPTPPAPLSSHLRRVARGPRLPRPHGYPVPLENDGDFRLPLGLALGSPIFPWSCEGKLGVLLESLQGPSWPDTIVTICMSCFMTGDPDKE